jgi:hypothetical protein
MPKIVTFQAQRGADILQLPARAQTEDYSIQHRTGQQIAGAGETLRTISEKIRAQQDEIDASGLIGEYEGRIRNVQVEADTETTDAQERMKKFNEKAVSLQRELSGLAKNPRVSRAFQAHVGRNYPVQQYNYQARTLEYQLKQQFASLTVQRDRFSRLAAETEDPDDRDVYIKQYESLVDKLTAGGLADPLVMQKEKEAFREQAALDQMDVLRFRNPDKLFELEAKGVFRNVDPRKREAIMDRAIRERAHRAAEGQAELRQAMNIWRESIYRETENHITNRTLTLEWIEEYGYAMDDTKLAAYRKALKDQLLGVGTGDPTVEREMQRQVYNPRLNPSAVLARLDAQYVAGAVGYEKYGPWISHLNSEINRRSGEARSDRKEGEVRVRELQSRRATSYLILAESVFRTTGGLSVDFDGTAAEARAQFTQEYLAKVDAYGGSLDGGAAYAELMPRYIVQVESRLDARLTFLRENLGKYNTKESLKQARAAMGEAEYERHVGWLLEYQAIRSNVDRLARTRKEATERGKGQK